VHTLQAMKPKGFVGRSKPARLELSVGSMRSPSASEDEVELLKQ